MLFQAIRSLIFKDFHNYKRNSSLKGRGRAETFLQKLKLWLAWQICKQNLQARRTFLLPLDFVSLAASEIIFLV